MTRAYIDGFTKMAEDCGVDPQALLKVAQSVTGYWAPYSYGSGAQTDERATPRVDDYLNWLTMHQNDIAAARDRVSGIKPDWAPADELRREGYLKGLGGSVKELPADAGNAYFKPLALWRPDVYIPTKVENGVKYWPRSTLAHEVGHNNTANRKRFGIKVPTAYEFFRKYPQYGVDHANVHRVGGLPDRLLGGSIDSITNGVNKTDMLRAEEDAWNQASGKYDPVIRDAALDTYRKATSDAYNRAMLSQMRRRLVGTDGFSVPSYSANPSVVPDGYKHPDVQEFWRTNTADSAYQYLKPRMNESNPKAAWRRGTF